MIFVDFITTHSYFFFRKSYLFFTLINLLIYLNSAQKNTTKCGKDIRFVYFKIHAEEK